MEPKRIDLGEKLRTELAERKDDFAKFFRNIVLTDPVLEKMWGFGIINGIYGDNPEKHYLKSIKAIDENQITEDDFFHINHLRESANPDDHIFFDAIAHFALLTTRVSISKKITDGAGLNLPIPKLVNYLGGYYLSETDTGFTITKCMFLPEYIEEYTKTVDDNVIHEDICLIFLVPPNDESFLQSQINYWGNYTAKLLQKSHHSLDISFGNTSFLKPIKNADEPIIHRYTLSVEVNGKKQKLIDCPALDRFKGLLDKQTTHLSKILEDKSDYDLQDDNVRWCEARQEIEIKFYDLLSEYDPGQHGFLPGYLKQGLMFFQGHKKDEMFAQQREPGKSFFDDVWKKKDDDTKELVPVGDIYDEGSLPKSNRPDDLVINYLSYEKVYREIAENVPPKTKKFIKILLKNPDSTEEELAELMGTTKAMIKKHKQYVRQAAKKQENPFSEE